MWTLRRLQVIFIFQKGVVNNLRRKGFIEIKRYRQDLAGDVSQIITDYCRTSTHCITQVLDKILKIPFGPDDVSVTIDEGEILTQHPNLYR